LKLNKFMSKEIKKIFLIALLSRFLVFITAIISDFIIFKESIPWRSPLPFFKLFAVWDSSYYSHIAVHGYTELIYWGFYPLYSLLVKVPYHILSIFNVPDPAVISGFFISNILFFPVVYYFYKLTKLFFENEKISFISTIFFCFFPSSVFFSAVYSESIFLLLIVSSIYYIERGDLKISVPLAILSGITRPVGFLIFIPFIYKFLKSRERKYFISSILIFFSPIIFFLYSYFNTGNLFIYFLSKSVYWQNKLSNPIGFIMDLEIINQITILFSILLYLLSLKYFLRKKSLYPYLIYFTILFLIYLFSNSIPSFVRYSLTLLPIFWFMGKVSSKNKYVKFGFLLYCIIFLVIGTSMFVNWYYFI